MASVLPQSFTTDIIPPGPPLVRTINELRWWSAVIFLDENPSMNSIEASPSKCGWSWRLERTNDKFVYIKNTYFEDKLILTTNMNTNIQNRDEFIKYSFPCYKMKSD